jgi:hypothetical protein
MQLQACIIVAKSGVDVVVTGINSGMEVATSELL